MQAEHGALPVIQQAKGPTLLPASASAQMYKHTHYDTLQATNFEGAQVSRHSMGLYL